MLTKAQIINSLDRLPESFSLDEFIDHLIFVEKVEKGLDDSINGRVHSKQEAKEKLSKWLRKSGLIQP
jgi:predicted transcriptional regulator